MMGLDAELRNILELKNLANKEASLKSNMERITWNSCDAEHVIIPQKSFSD